MTSPADHDVTLGNLCVKGRFGFEHVQQRDPERSRCGFSRASASPRPPRSRRAPRPVAASEREPPVRRDVLDDARLTPPTRDGTPAQGIPRFELVEQRREPQPAPRVVAVLERLEERDEQLGAVRLAPVARQEGRSGTRVPARQLRLGLGDVDADPADDVLARRPRAGSRRPCDRRGARRSAT